jgi:hypothetical protein
MKIIKQNIKLYKMAYKMDPTKKKNKNGGINKIVKGIAEAGKHLLIPGYSIIKGANKTLTKLKPKPGILPSIQAYKQSQVGVTLTKTLTSKPKAKAANLERKKPVKNKKYASSVQVSGGSGVQPTAKSELPKGNTNIKPVKPKVKAAEAKPKKVKVKIKHNKTKIKIKK